MINSPNSPTEIIRVSISEAGRLFGVNAQTIRRAIKNEEITYVVVAGRYKINFESLVKWSQSKTTVKNKSDARGIGQYVDKWKINNKLYSPNKKSVKKEVVKATNVAEATKASKKSTRDADKKAVKDAEAAKGAEAF